MEDIYNLLNKAKLASQTLYSLTNDQRNTALEKIAEGLLAASEEIIAANKKDLDNAKGQISEVMLDRLMLNSARIKAMADGIIEVKKLESPLGMVEKEYTNHAGLLIKKQRVPLGVIAIIYESRPNVTADAAALCIKSGNACVLRGGKEAINSNLAVAAVIKKSLDSFIGGLGDAVQILQDTSREGVNVLMTARGYVDLLIPRGGKGLIEAVVNGARGVPVIETGSGICHIYVDKTAPLDMAAAILYNAKTSRPSVCNAAEVCLVHKDIAAEFLPCAAKLLRQKGVELRLDGSAAKYVDGVPAGEQDFDTEFLDYILAVKTVGSVEEAVEHINRHSSHHSEAIVTQSTASADYFCKMTDSAAVYVNASTRFTDGGEFGLGCEMGISTQKLAARGPMGLYELTSYKYVICGSGQVRE